MQTRYDFGADQGQPIAYVRPVSVADLPEDRREEAMGSTTLCALHSAEGERLALVRDRRLAFVLARQNNMTPVAVH